MQILSNLICFSILAICIIFFIFSYFNILFRVLFSYCEYWFNYEGEYVVLFLYFNILFFLIFSYCEYWLNYGGEYVVLSLCGSKPLQWFAPTTSFFLYYFLFGTSIWFIYQWFSPTTFFVTNIVLIRSHINMVI